MNMHVSGDCGFWDLPYGNGMNRIREIRTKRGMSLEDLANLVGTSAPQIARLELGQRRLTVDWMNKIATALDVSPAELIATAVMAGTTNEVQEIDASEDSGVRSALATHGIRVYRVVSDSVALAGIGSGDVITVNAGITDFASLNSLDVVLVMMSQNANSDGFLALRQFIQPGLLVTNRTGANLAIHFNDPSIFVRLIGVVMKK